MADQNPRGQTPAAYDSRLSEPLVPSTSLVEDLGEIVDDIRQIATDLGARPYTVHVVRVRWSGGQVGRGEPTVVSETSMLPTPKVAEVGALDRATDAAGIVERGDVILTGVSPRYTEDELEAMFATGDGDEVFVEVRVDRRDGTTKPRRFALARAPERRPTMADWRLLLRRHSGDRERTGARRPARQERW